MSNIIRKSPNTPSRTIEIALQRWESVRRLCRRSRQGAVRIRVRADELTVGERVQIAFSLPGAFVARIPSRVVKSQPDPRGGTPELTIELCGLSAHVVDRLRALSAPHAVPPTPRRPAVGRGRGVAAGTPKPERITEWESASWEQLLPRVCSRMSVSELLRNNQQLRDQIDGLSMRMLPKADAA